MKTQNNGWHAALMVKLEIKFPFKRKACPVLEVKLPSIVYVSRLVNVVVVFGIWAFNDTFPLRKDANKDFMITFGFQHKILGQIIPESFSHCCFRPSVYNFNK